MSLETISFDDYRGRLGYGSTFLARALISPAHAKSPFEPSPQMRLGTFLHESVLTPEPQAPITRQQEFLDSKIYAGKDASNRALLKMQGAFEALVDHKFARRILWHTLNSFEKSLFTEINGLPIKVRPDCINTADGMIVDFKTASCAREDDFERKIFGDFNYCLQAALYFDVAKKLMPEKDFKVFTWVVVETDAPYGVSVFMAEKDTLDIGRERYYKAIDIVKECHEKNEWPCYKEEIKFIGAPKWLRR